MPLNKHQTIMKYLNEREYEVSDLRQRLELEMMKGSKPCVSDHSPNCRTQRAVRSIRRFPKTTMNQPTWNGSLALLFAVAIQFGLGERAFAATTNVSFGNFSFSPKNLTINVGDTVVWNNTGGSHTVTGDGSDPFCGSGFIPTSCSHTFNTAGTFPYHCIPHQFSFNMVGTVTVQAAANNPPSVTITNPATGAVLAP